MLNGYCIKLPEGQTIERIVCGENKQVNEFTIAGVNITSVKFENNSIVLYSKSECLAIIPSNSIIVQL